MKAKEKKEHKLRFFLFSAFLVGQKNSAEMFSVQNEKKLFCFQQFRLTFKNIWRRHCWFESWSQSYKENFRVDLRYAGILGL